MNRPTYFLLQVIRKILNGIVHSEPAADAPTSEIACRLVAKQAAGYSPKERHPRKLSMRLCYHWRQNEARPHSNFCGTCCRTHPLFFPPHKRSKRNVALSGLLYILAATAAGWLIYETVRFVLTK